MVPLLRSGIGLAAAIPVALAADTISIAHSLIAGAVAYPVSRYLIRRGRGHAVVHAHHV